MDREKQLEQQIEQYKQLAKENPNIDLSSLALGAFQSLGSERDYLSKREKRWGYLISIGLPPLGLIFALRFYFSGKADGKSAALICAALTAFSIIAVAVLFQVTLSSSNISLQQIQQTNPQDIYNVFQ